MSPKAALQTLIDAPGVVCEGLRHGSCAAGAVGLRDEVATAFRVFLGVTAAHWWEQDGAACEVVFGVTGTADTTLLEQAIKRSGGRTVHAVHGQATGPNFAGISDLALFRSQHDAKAYMHLGSYGACGVQRASFSGAKRGSNGLLLLSNLAHPMNSGFQRFGLRDEESLLAAVGSAARTLGASAQPLLWKPHPVIEFLPTETREALRRTAKSYGFEEFSPDEKVESVAGACRWIVTSPSTVALDLLQAGYLCIVVDPQGSVLDTALSGLPRVPCDPDELAVLCCDFDSPDSYTRAWAAAIEIIGPARALDLRAPLE
jgi:hypothetical protein